MQNNQENVYNILSDLNTFFDGDAWKEFTFSLSNGAGPKKQKQDVIQSFINQVKDGNLSPNLIFVSYEPLFLVELFASYPNKDFLIICLKLVAEFQNNISLPFLEMLLQKYPQCALNLVDSTYNFKIFSCFVRLIISSYLKIKNKVIVKSLLSYDLLLVITHLFSLIDTPQKINNATILLVKFYENGGSKLIQTIKQLVPQFLSIRSKNVINSILNFMEVGDKNKLFKYENVFSDVFGETSDGYFISILMERLDSTDESVIQSQIQSLDFNISEKLRNSFSMKKETVVSDKDLIIFSKSFDSSGKLPQKLAHFAMFQQEFMDNNVLPRLEKLSLDNKCTFNGKEIVYDRTLIKNLFIELTNKKKAKQIFQNPEKKKPEKKLEQIINSLKKSDDNIDSLSNIANQVPIELFSTIFFKYFHDAIYSRHSSDLKSFCHNIYSKVILKLVNIMPFTKIIVDFLSSNLCDQHRFSLSMIAIRCPLDNYIESHIFNSKNEIQIIRSLLEAAIHSCFYLTTNTNEKDDKIFIHPLLILRYRWRALRGGVIGAKIAWFPEFLSLVNNDIMLFLKWELAESKPNEHIKRSQIFANLCITTTHELIPLIFKELLSNKSLSSVVIEILIPIISNCPIEKIILPENPNLEILFKMKTNLWCSPIMNHPKVIKVLSGTPPLAFSQSLLICNPTIADFEKYPCGFYSLMYNYNHIIGLKPPLLEKIQFFFQKDLSHIEFFKILDFPRFAKASLASLMSKKMNYDFFLKYLNQNIDDKEFSELCLFFTICNSQFSYALKFLKKKNYLISSLRSSFLEDSLFTSERDWYNSLINFAFFCASKRIIFLEPVANQNWKIYISFIKQLKFPQRILENNYQLMEFTEYLKVLNIEDNIQASIV